MLLAAVKLNIYSETLTILFIIKIHFDKTNGTRFVCVRFNYQLLFGNHISVPIGVLNSDRFTNVIRLQAQLQGC